MPEPLKLSCEYTGPIRDVVLWSKNFVRMETVNGFRRTSVEKLSGGRVTITDSIKKQKTEYLDSGNYTCFVPNSTFSETVTVHASKPNDIAFRIDYLSISMVTLVCDNFYRNIADVISLIN